MKKIIALLIIAFLATPLMAADKKAKPSKGKVVSMTAESIKLKIKKEEKEFKITADTKIINKEGAKVAAADAQFEMAMVKAAKTDAGTAAMIKEYAAKAKKKKE
jgi:hypothetical protein